MELIIKDKTETGENAVPDADALRASTRVDADTLQAKTADGAAFSPAAADVLELFADEPDVNVTAVDIPVKGDEVLTFYIKRLSPKEASMLATRGKRATNGSIALRDKDAQEAHENALSICECVVTNSGSEAEPLWRPLWAYEEVAGQSERRNPKGEVLAPRVRGLLELSSAEAKLFSGLIIAHVYGINPELNPFLKKKADEILMQQLSGRV